LELRVLEKNSEFTFLQILVIDSGIGLTPEECNSLFERFSQVTKGEEYGGSGLGLVIARNLANLMNGNISVRSTKGEGTTFCCTIQCENASEPFHLASATPTWSGTSVSAASAPAVSPKHLTVLVVDDNALNRKLLAHNLEKAGYFVQLAVDGNDAIGKFSQGQVDVIMMDIVMPNLDGLTATQMIRQIELGQHRPRVPIIALTGNALEAQRMEALAAGMDDYIVKPFKKEEVLAKISALL
jgi:CheY-like chemotaxis protein